MFTADVDDAPALRERPWLQPAGVGPDRVEARFDNGVLTVWVPQPEQAKPRRVKID